MGGNAGEATVAAIKENAPKYGLEVVEYTTTVPPAPEAALEQEFQRIAAAIKPGDIDAIYHIPAHFIPTENFLEVQVAKRLQGVQTIMPAGVEVTQEGRGGLFAYAENYFSVGQATAVFVDKILKGTKPTDIPVEYPKVNSLVINLKIAKETGVAIPDSVITRADQKIQ